MTDSNASGLRQSFGVLRVFGDSSTYFFRGFVLFVGTAVLGQILIVLSTVGMGFTGLGALTSLGIDRGPVTSPVLVAVYAALLMTIYSMVGAIIALGAVDMKQGNRPNFLRYVTTAIRSAPYILGCAVLMAILFFVAIALASMAIGLVVQAIPLTAFILIPAVFVLVIYLFAMLSVANPSIVIEGTGFSAIARSLALTRNYRWAIVGVFMITAAILVLASIIFGALVALSFASGVSAGENFGLIFFGTQVFNVVFGGVLTGFMGVLVAHVFMRLKEIKEGYGFENVGSIFD